MTIRTTRDGDIIVAEIYGRLDTTTAPEVGAELDRIIEAGASRLVVDLEDLEYVSSAGLRILLSAAKRLSGPGSGLRFCNLNETVAEVFEISGFDTIFELCPDRAAAVEGF